MDCVEYWGLLNHDNFTWVIFKKYPSKYIYTLFKIVIFVSAVILGAIWIGFKTSIWCFFLTHILFWLNNGKYADPYIINPPSLSRTRTCDDEPDGTLFLWFGSILFLRHQSNIMDHSGLLATEHVCKNKKPHLYVHKKTTTKLSRPSNH